MSENEIVLAIFFVLLLIIGGLCEIIDKGLNE